MHGVNFHLRVYFLQLWILQPQIGVWKSSPTDIPSEKEFRLARLHTQILDSKRLIFEFKEQEQYQSPLMHPWCLTNDASHSRIPLNLVFQCSTADFL